MQELFESLIGKKATIFKYSEFGFPQSIPCVIEKVERKDYAQYSNQLHVVFRPKRKRTSYVWRPMDFQSFAVFEGHLQLESEMYVETLPSSPGVTVRQSLRSFSSGYLDRALSSTDQKPIVIQRKDFE